MVRATFSQLDGIIFLFGKDNEKNHTLVFLGNMNIQTASVTFALDRFKHLFFILPAPLKLVKRHVV